jgi:hypothetical protein
MKHKLHLLLLLAVFMRGMFITSPAWAQYSPPAGWPGSIAIHKDSSIFKSWASQCTVTRGWMDSSDPSLGYASTGDDNYATGVADGLQVVSLGDGGSALLQFPEPISNGPGFDFAVFENSFDDQFLELAFVEVSSNGMNFVRFPSVSLTPTANQVGPFDYLDTELIHNLAGKFRVFYGTPFDLEEIKDSANLNVNAITHVRIVDVVGRIHPEMGSYDAWGNLINDPWPTPFPSGGFDLDAVGVINESESQNIASHASASLQIYPNPVKAGQPVLMKNHYSVTDEIIIRCKTPDGRTVQESTLSAAQTFDTRSLLPGVYIIERVSKKSGTFAGKLIVY